MSQREMALRTDFVAAIVAAIYLAFGALVYSLVGWLGVAYGSVTLVVYAVIKLAWTVWKQEKDFISE